jgi:hypothetical protein
MGFRLMTCVVALSLAVGLAAQNRATGRVLNRSGVGLSGCQLDFYYGGQGQVTYRVYTDQSGTYYIDGARNGSYSVTVMQGGRSVQIPVTVDRLTISPNPLSVPW